MKDTDGTAKPWVRIQRTRSSMIFTIRVRIMGQVPRSSDEYDWDILAFEVEECPTTRIEDEYQYYLREVVDRFKDWIEYNGDLPKAPSRKELAI
ncbi:unnamed protein product [Rhizophagus irregularis]|nr:unnamed protein product [Rhizophagus irregularis]